MRTPEFWHDDTMLSRLLSPLGRLYAWAVARRLTDAESYRPKVPVICVGNIVAGGAGKTPTCLALAERLHARGRHPHFLTRGYGGTEVGPRAVDPVRHDAARVGDEALLLAGHAPTWVARWRPDGAMAAAEMGADLIVMDDGFQNASLEKDLSLVVVDGGYGFGNARPMPAGPCREDIRAGLARADAVVMIGDDRTGAARWFGSLPVLRARLIPGPEAADFAGRKVVAFAGIGRPAKFFDTLESVGAQVVAAHSFPDHHPYGRAEIEALIQEAEAQEALLSTTAKDAVRVPSDLRSRLSVLTVRLEWDTPEAVDLILDHVDSRF
ncbi:tetraacyldisaccharide 4'-kinase [Magnetospirillum aberrantis]|uniref:Tetraacyldisaccharide 4'-kinase n=1 Tax=Magnetospirillum aberrantis SpK TaxID=908842 RepID=A0A7C9QUQ0_9PROT|nr:tetraacyldisaccharide 4'-kinase [Magnetospirillum aberrantis]NFV80857.1 tetraacyldisaccharide 4'-kinase [Magnetospirillum aberrantis SpK]